MGGRASICWVPKNDDESPPRGPPAIDVRSGPVEVHENVTADVREASSAIQADVRSGPVEVRENATADVREASSAIQAVPRKLMISGQSELVDGTYTLQRWQENEHDVWHRQVNEESHLVLYCMQNGNWGVISDDRKDEENCNIIQSEGPATLSPTEQRWGKKSRGEFMCVDTIEVKEAAPRNLLISGKSETVDGTYTLQYHRKNEKDVWKRTTDEGHHLALYCMRNGHWAVTNADLMDEGSSNIICSEETAARMPHRQRWGVRESGVINCAGTIHVKEAAPQALSITGKSEIVDGRYSLQDRRENGHEVWLRHYEDHRLALYYMKTGRWAVANEELMDEGTSNIIQSEGTAMRFPHDQRWGVKENGEFKSLDTIHVVEVN